MEAGRSKPYKRKHVRSFISTPCLTLHIRYSSRALDLEHSCAPSPNSFQSYRIFLSRCVLPLLSSLHTVLSRAQRRRVRHHPRVTAIAFDLEPHHRCYALCVEMNGIIEQTAQWSVYPPGAQIGTFGPLTNYLPILLGAAIEGRLYHRVRPDHRDSAMRWLLYDSSAPNAILQADSREPEARYSFHSPRTRVTRLCCIISKSPLLCDVANSHMYNVNVRFQTCLIGPCHLRKPKRSKAPLVAGDPGQ